ncbi:MAG: molecular chaperone DnaK [Epulopiscium sp. Nele67-Bin004]|nr:MAG: molecular chaperone DnaK [Epulopiscium sp. Nele67-Bin004]
MLCIGIDLGTTNSVLATVIVKPNGDAISKVVEVQRAVDIYNSMGASGGISRAKKATLPSCVYYRAENGYKPLVGDFAKIQYPLRPHLVAKSIKSQMGKPTTEGLSDDIPDKTPAQISANILRHMINETKQTFKQPITNAVITVPANFDSAMCKATIEAAELAGITTKNEDGTDRPILLSEPNAVIYDLINQIKNGELHGDILDVSTKKNVLVFDLGGGTLDITLHTIERRDNLQDVLKVSEIATNRYTKLGGDDFDEAIAKAMYERYLKQYSSHPKVVSTLKNTEAPIMAQLRVYAENIKIDLNEMCTDDYISDSSWESNWDDDDDDDDEIRLQIGGSMGGVGYSYDDSFTKDEIENILGKFMAPTMVFDDYKKLDTITNTNNIIFPILDVLKKASEKLQVKDINIDAVIVNGGMSKFYMIKERLKQLFGFDPIVALDPDQSVARGAAIYHHYLQKYAELQDNMKTVEYIPEVNQDNEVNEVQETKQNTFYEAMGIQFGNSILNDSLYLGTKNGATAMIVPTGSELPYMSDIMLGFRIEPGQNKISIPIKSQNLDGTYRTISSGNISFKGKYSSGAYVAFKLHMGTNKVITMNAWTSLDEKGEQKIEEGIVEISTTTKDIAEFKAKFIAPDGSTLNARDEINNLIQLCNNLSKQTKSSNVSTRIKTIIDTICNAGNKEDFKPLVLENLHLNHNDIVINRLFIIAFRLGDLWTQSEYHKLAKLCLTQLSSELSGIGSSSKVKINTNSSAIKLLAICGTPEDINKLHLLHRNHHYKQACLYAHAKTGTNIDWIINQLEQNELVINVAQIVSAIASALRNDTQISKSRVEIIVKKLGEIIDNIRLKQSDLMCVILAIGCICDTHKINSNILDDVKNTLLYLPECYGNKVANECEMATNTTLKVINGANLEEIEKKYLVENL